MKPSELITQIRALLKDPDKFCQTGYAAVDKFWNRVDSNDPRACRWCIIGAENKVLKTSFMQIESNERQLRMQVESAMQTAMLIAIVAAGDFMSVPQFNDSQPHAAVMAMLDRAAVIAKERYEA